MNQRRSTSRARLALVLVAIIIAAVAQMSTARAASHARSGDAHESSLSTFTHHEDSAVVPANQLARGARAFAEMLSVPLASVLASVALLALWFTASVRRRDRLPCAVVTYRRRGPPASSHVN